MAVLSVLCAGWLSVKVAFNVYWEHRALHYL
jgi:hypothetical protein